jgi:hypothetical protein
VLKKGEKKGPFCESPNAEVGLEELLALEMVTPCDGFCSEDSIPDEEDDDMGVTVIVAPTRSPEERLCGL